MKLSIRWTIIIGCIVLIWGTHIIITPSSYLMTKRVLTQHMHDIMVNISDLTVEQAHNHLNKARSAASLAKQLLGSNVVSNDIQGSSALERYLFDQLSIYPHLSGIYVGGMTAIKLQSITNQLSERIHFQNSPGQMQNIDYPIF